MNFEEAKKFGDKLEKVDAIKLIQKLYPGHIIKSPKAYRINGKAVPDHIVVKDKKIVALFDSKNKNAIYNVKGHEPFFSTDEKHEDYRYFAEKYNVPCWLIFYCAEKDAEHFYIANVNDKPKFYKEVNNRYGRHWFGYYVSQCEKINKDKNFTEKDIQEVYSEKNVVNKKKLMNQIVERCKPEYSFKPMKKEGIMRILFQIQKARTSFDIDAIASNLLLAGEKMSTFSSSWKKYG